jgi:Flp pilus assembly protein TadD
MGLALSFAALSDEVYQRAAGLRLRRSLLGALAAGLTAMWTGEGLAAVDRSLDWKDEASILAASLRIDPNNHVALRSLALLAAREGRMVEAEQHVRRALALEPDRWRSWSVLCSVLLDEDKLNEAEQACTRSLRGPALEPRDWVNLAAVYARQRRWTDCARACDQALACKRDDADAHYLRAVSAANLGWYDNARASLRDALTIDPQHAGARELSRQLEQRDLAR